MYVIGLDLGTSALKGLVVNQKGEMVAEATAGYPLATPQVGFSEQDPNDWLRASTDGFSPTITGIERRTCRD